jgi:hypothetical protein
MTKNGLDIQTISTKRTDKQADRVLLFGQLREKKEKADPSHFLKFLLASRTNGTFGFARNTSQRFAKAKEPFFARADKCLKTIDCICQILTSHKQTGHEFW